MELANVANQKLYGLFKEWLEIFADLFDYGAKRCSCILFDHRNAILDEHAELGAEILHVRIQRILRNMLTEICKASARMGLYSWHLIVQGRDQSWHDVAVERFLEVVGHVVCQLSDAVQSCVANLGVRVLQMLNNGRDHRLDLAHFVHILADLGERHNTRMLVPPVLVVCNRVLY